MWEIVYSKDGSVKEVSKVMQLKGHKACESTHSPKANLLSFNVFILFNYIISIMLPIVVFSVRGVLEIYDNLYWRMSAKGFDFTKSSVYGT